MSQTRILVTGADGFIGKNLRVALGERAGVEVLPIHRASSDAALGEAVAAADAVIHLAGVNRPQNLAEFAVGNADFTAHLCARLAARVGRFRLRSHRQFRPSATILTVPVSAVPKIILSLIHI